jgi:hypothetical protein
MHTYRTTFVLVRHIHACQPADAPSDFATTSTCSLTLKHPSTEPVFIAIRASFAHDTSIMCNTCESIVFGLASCLSSRQNESEWFTPFAKQAHLIVLAYVRIFKLLIKVVNSSCEQLPAREVSKVSMPMAEAGLTFSLSFFAPLQQKASTCEQCCTLCSLPMHFHCAPCQ